MLSHRIGHSWLNNYWQLSAAVIEPAKEAPGNWHAWWLIVEGVGAGEICKSSQTIEGRPQVQPRFSELRINRRHGAQLLRLL